MTTPLFPACVLPGCRQPVAEHGDTCDGCLAAFGPMLQPSGRPRLTEAEIARRDRETIKAYRRQLAAADGVA